MCLQINGRLHFYFTLNRSGGWVYVWGGRGSKQRCLSSPRNRNSWRNFKSSLRCEEPRKVRRNVCDSIKKWFGMGKKALFRKRIWNIKNVEQPSMANSGQVFKLNMGRDYSRTLCNSNCLAPTWTIQDQSKARHQDHLTNKKPSSYEPDEPFG